MKKNSGILSLMLVLFVFVTITTTFLPAAAQKQDQPYLSKNAVIRYDGLERADTTQPIIYLVFTGGDYNDGGKTVLKTLKKKKAIAHFFFTGDFYRDRSNKSLIKKLIKHDHYLGPHSDKHLLYASWNDRDSMCVTKDSFIVDLSNNYKELKKFGISQKEAPLFMPPYEWYNQQISSWTTEYGSILVNYSPGTSSNADYTTPDMGDRYLSSDYIFENILQFESTSSCGMNGFILLIHIGTHPDRKDKLYARLPELIYELRLRGYRFGSLQKFIGQS
jgi:peptidoglycan/xylan/chitin deacetylase (PgdA/CDA1 family)